MSDQRVEVQFRGFVDQPEAKRRAAEVTFVGSDQAEPRATAWAVGLLERHAAEMLRIVKDVLETPVLRRSAEHRSSQLDP